MINLKNRGERMRKKILSYCLIGVLLLSIVDRSIFALDVNDLISTYVGMRQYSTRPNANGVFANDCYFELDGLHYFPNYETYGFSVIDPLTLNMTQHEVPDTLKVSDKEHSRISKYEIMVHLYHQDNTYIYNLQTRGLAKISDYPVNQANQVITFVAYDSNYIMGIRMNDFDTSYVYDRSSNTWMSFSSFRSSVLSSGVRDQSDNPYFRERFVQKNGGWFFVGREDLINIETSARENIEDESNKRVFQNNRIMGETYFDRNVWATRKRIVMYDENNTMTVFHDNIYAQSYNASTIISEDEKKVYVYIERDSHSSNMLYRIELNTPPDILTYSPQLSKYHKGAVVPVQFTSGDQDTGQTLTNTLQIGTSANGTQYFSGNTRSYNFNSSSVNLAWNASANEYQGRVYYTANVTDSYASDSENSSFLIYNERPSYNFVVSDPSLNTSLGSQITFNAKVWDVGGGNLQVSCNFAGQNKNTVVAQQLSQPSSDNVTFTFDMNTQGTFSNPSFTITDEWGGTQSFTMNQTVNVYDFMGEFENFVSTDVDLSTADVLMVVSSENVQISNTSGNRNTLTSISNTLGNRNAQGYHLGRSSNSTLFGSYSGQFDSSGSYAGFRAYVNSLIDSKDLNATAFVIGQDTPDYQLIFEDLDHDYKALGVAERSQETVSEANKAFNQLFVRVEHDISSFDDAGTLSSKHNPSFVEMTSLKDNRLPLEAKAQYWGIFNLTAYASDQVYNNTSYNKNSAEDQKAVIFHYAPTALIDMNDNADYSSFHVSARRSSDTEFYRSLPDNGIVKLEWQIKAGNTWYDFSSDVFETDIPYSYLGNDVTDVRLRVYDCYDAVGVTQADVNANLKARLTVDKPLPYELKTNETFTATMEIVTSETIQEPVQCEVLTWGGSLSNMSFVSQSGNTYTYRSDYTVPGSVADGDYKIEGYVNTIEGSSLTRSTDIRVLNNLPPTINIVNVLPVARYAGDDLTATVSFDDPNDDPLDITLNLTREGVPIYNYTGTHVAVSGAYAELISVVINDAQANDNYTLTATANDGSSSATDSYTFAVEELGITGQVDHTTQWDQNRIAFNQNKTNTDDSPRPYSYYWAGEKFLLSAVTSTIDEVNSTVTANSVEVEILNETYDTSLLKLSSTTWSGELFDNAFRNLADGNYIFRFTVTYSNGTVRTDDVTITIDTDEEFYRFHRLF